MALNGTTGVGEGVGVEPPPEFVGEATAFEAGVDCGAGTKLHGAGVGDVVGISRRVPGVVDGMATVIGAGVEVTVVDDIAAVLTVGVGREVAIVLEDTPAAVDVSVDGIAAVLEEFD